MAGFLTWSAGEDAVNRAEVHGRSSGGSILLIVVVATTV
jgi:hypothetical protein